MSYGELTLNDGNKIPRIAYGAGSVWKHEDVTDNVRRALDAGFYHLDNAQYYSNEEFVGNALAKSGVARGDVYITSKFSFGDVETALEASLTKLRVEYLDLYLIHNPASIPPGQIPQFWAKLEDIRARGQAKSIGVSNFGVAELKTLLGSATVVPAVNQIRLHPYNYHDQLPTLQLSAKHGIATEAYSSLTPITSAPGGPLDPVLAKIALRIGGTPAQVIFAWLRQKGIVIVTTSGKSERLREYLAVPSLPTLTDDEIVEIETVGKKGADFFAARARNEKASTMKANDVEAQTPMVLAPPSRWRLWQMCTVALGTFVATYLLSRS